MSKRKFEGSYDAYKGHKSEKIKKYSLDSDEEDEIDDGNVLDENDIEGEEETVTNNEGDEEERFTAFNMREEMEEGHFDKEGHFIWKNEKEVRDNWLDNIDWQKIQTKKNARSGEKGLGEDSDDSDGEPFEEIQAYKQIITYMEPKETINKALSRLGGKNKKLSSIERLKRKKAGLLDENEEVTKLTEFVDKILSETGNMDIYQETYEQISKKIANYGKKSKPKGATEPELDMYAEDFNTKESEKLGDTAGTSNIKDDEDDDDTSKSNKEVSWEFKWDLKATNIEGPFSTQQMSKWANEGYFKTGVWARRCGENSNFYSTNRIDFELYF